MSISAGAFGVRAAAVPIAAAKPRLDSKGTSASMVHSESLRPSAELRGAEDGLVGGVRVALPVLRPGGGACGGAQHAGGSGSVGAGNGLVRIGTAGTGAHTRSRFSVSVPVLSKQMVSTRPSASMVRGARTSAPRAVSRCAAASCASVATSGSPSGTAATAIATPSATAWRSVARRSSANADTVAPPASVSGSTLLVSSRSRAWIPADDRRRRPPRSRGARRCRHRWPRRSPGHVPATMVLPSNSMLAPVGVGDRDWVHLLVHRQRLAGEQGLVDLEVVGHQQPGVGRAPRRVRPGR